MAGWDRRLGELLEARGGDGGRSKGAPMIFASPPPAITTPEIPLAPFVLDRASELGAKPALIDGPTGRTITYAELARGVPAVASNLHRRGAAPGDVFAIYSPNLPEYALAFLGAAAAGCANTTANPLFTADELAWQLADARARFLLTVPDLLDKALEAAARAAVEEVFVVGEAPGATPFESLTEPVATAPELDIAPRSTTVALPYSSGTTGLPKGVMLSHRNLVANVCQLKPVHRIGTEDTVVGVLPFFHIYGMTVVMSLALHGGGTVVTMPRFDLEQFLGLLAQHGVTRAHLVPPIILALAQHPALLIAHPAVTDAAVVPGPDEAAGEVPVAYVVTSGELSGEELMDYVASRVAPHKRIRRVEVIDAIARSPSASGRGGIRWPARSESTGASRCGACARPWRPAGSCSRSGRSATGGSSWRSTACASMSFTATARRGESPSTSGPPGRRCSSCPAPSPTEWCSTTWCRPPTTTRPWSTSPRALGAPGG